MSNSCNYIDPNYTTENGIPLKEIERSIIKTYRKDIWIPFIEAIKEFELVDDGDKIAVCVSGGKDSLLTAKLFQELQRHGKKQFEIEYICMDPGFNPVNRNNLIKNCEHLGIPVKIRESQVFEIADKLGDGQPCYLCARMRRGFLYNFAQELGCNKMALGHHHNDVIETTMINMFYSGNFKTMLPKIKSKNFENMELIRPLYYVKENDIKRYSANTGLTFMDCGCTVTQKRVRVGGSKRAEIKRIIEDIKKINPDVEKSIMRSAFNVHIEAIMGIRKDGEQIMYLDERADFSNYREE